MLRINASMDAFEDDYEGYYDPVVGFFPIDDTLPPFQPQRVRLVTGANGLIAKSSDTEAWVAHDGHGRVAGFQISELYAEECANPEWWLNPANPEGFGYDSPDNYESYIPV